ncbi:uncharacterized protein LOC128512950 [Clarias gariepinus]|uniref:uncharacterized protein LOC128512950 n=1 Tax=Clarias gariepinus TaxID=13013 RepID=UPI00234D2C10|nr:uncharacterized protein LOC128512950 [Clarias gariepinus]
MLEREYLTSDFTENLYTHSSRRYQDIMTSFISLYIVLSTVCVNLLSAVPEFNVSGPVGSTAVLPCQLTSGDINILYIRWEIKVKTQYQTVFERVGEESTQDKGYEGRVDVPVEELRKGNCSLVLRDLRLNDTEIYTSYLLVTNTKRGLPLIKEEISHVHLTVHERTDKHSGSSGDTLLVDPHCARLDDTWWFCLVVSEEEK